MKRLALALPALFLIHGCSVIVGRQFDVPQCSDDTQCDVLNTRDNIGSEACHRWQCAPGQANGSVCVLRDRRDDDDDGDPATRCGGSDCDDHNASVYANGLGVAASGDAGVDAGSTDNCGTRTTLGPAPECYNGRDDNCNGAIDEGDGVIVAQSPAATVMVSADNATLNYSEGRDGELGALFSHFVSSSVTYAAELGVFRGATADALAPVAYASMPDTVPSGGCFVQTMTGMESSPFCDFADVALDEVPGVANTWFAMSVNDKPCMHGQVRAGFLVRSGGNATFVMNGPDSMTNPFTGADVVGDQVCSGTNGEGASGIAIASLPTSGGFGPEALALWNARALDSTPTCPSSDTQVRALGLEYDATAQRVDAPAGDTAVPLGTTTQSGRPAVVAVSSPDSASSGYLVAFGTHAATQTQLTLRAVARANGMAINAGEPLAIATTDVVSDVALAPGPKSSGSFRVGVAWTQGCAATRSVWFTIASVDFVTRTVTADPPQQVSLAGTSGAPSALYVSSGFYSAGATIGGMAVDADHQGGWIVAWTRAGAANTAALAARRIALLDGRPVDAGEITISPESPAVLALPRLYPAPSGAAHLARLTYWDTTNHRLLGTEFLLPRPSSP